MFTQDQLAIRDAARRFAREKLKLFFRSLGSLCHFSSINDFYRNQTLLYFYKPDTETVAQTVFVQNPRKRR